MRKFNVAILSASIFVLTSLGAHADDETGGRFLHQLSGSENAASQQEMVTQRAPAQAEKSARGAIGYDSGKRAPLRDLIAAHAAANGVPFALADAVVRIESRYNPGVSNGGALGLMQIKPATARGMGYTGAPSGLLDARTNLTYAVPYLANAYHIAGRNEDGAVRLYAGGYYYVAKRKGMLGQLQTAHAARGVKGGARNETQTAALVDEAAPRETVAGPPSARTAATEKPVGKTRAARAQPPRADKAAPPVAAYAAAPEPENPVADLFKAFDAGAGAGNDPAR